MRLRMTTEKLPLRTEENALAKSAEQELAFIGLCPTVSGAPEKNKLMMMVKLY